MVIKKLISLIAIVGLLAAPVSAQGDGFPRTVSDLTGTPVTIPARPQIVALIGEDSALAEVIPADHLRHLDPTVPAVSAGQVDWSGVGLLVTPDLYAAAYPALMASAQAAGVPVFRTVPITSLDGWRQAVRQVGQAAGREDRAARMIVCLGWELAAIHAWTSGDPPVRVLVLTPEGYTFGRGTLITDLIAAAGGINAAAGAGFADYRQIDDPTIRALAPDVILLSPAWSASNLAAFSANPAYSGVPAVHNGRVYRLRFSPTRPGDPGWAVFFLTLLLHS